MVDPEEWNTRPFWHLNFTFASIFDKLKKYLQKRRLRQLLKRRNEITRARYNDSKRI